MNKNRELSARLAAYRDPEFTSSMLSRIDRAFAAHDAAQAAELAPKPCQHPRATAGGTCLDCFARI